MPAKPADRLDPPLRPAVHHILLALAAGPMHGLAIADEVERLSGGAIELGPGTLYRSLADMAETGLVAPAEAPAADVDPRRKHYRVTERGRRALSSETARLARLVEAAHDRGALPEGA